MKLFGIFQALSLSSHVARAAKTLLESGTVISFDEEARRVQVLYNSSVLIEGDRIHSIFPASRNVSVSTDVERVSMEGKIITPGFVDTHRHLWQSALRTLGSNTSLAEYYILYGEFAQAQIYTAEDVYLSQLVGIWESLNGGVTSILDHAHHTWSMNTSEAGLKASIDGGARTWWCYAMHNATDYSFEQQISDFIALSEAGSFRNTTTSLGLAYDGWTVNSDSLNKEIVQTALAQNISAFTTHYTGGPFLYLNSPRLLHSYEFLNISTPVVFSHSSFITPEDHLLLQSTNQHFSITPESEHHYGHTDSNSHLGLDQAALGIDTHFTYSADILSQARLWLQVVRYRFYTQVVQNWQVPTNNPMSVEQAFLLATRNGGLALHRPDIGVLVPGAKADIVVWDATTINTWAWRDPVAAVMLHSHVGNVQHVLVDGKFKKRDFKLVVDDEQGVRDRFLRSAARIQEASLALRPAKFGTDLDGIPYGHTLVVDVVRGPGDGYESMNPL